VYNVRSSGGNIVNYFHKDNLGSIVAITNSTGGIQDQYSYDAWGKRRNNNWTDATTLITTTDTIHGFTGHEMMDDVGLI
jgi:YD repeat-containing protein